MYTTFSVVELNPPLTSRRRRPVLFSLPPVVAVSFSPPVVKISQAPLTRSTQFTFTHAQFTHVQSNSREATHVHVQFQAHEEHPSSRPTPQPSLSTVPRILFSTYLRRPLRYSHRPSHNTHPENSAIDSQTDRSFYRNLTRQLMGEKPVTSMDGIYAKPPLFRFRCELFPTRERIFNLDISACKE